LAGGATLSSPVLDERVNSRGMKRWSMLKLCVTEPVLTKVIRLIAVGLLTRTLKPRLD
jgi:hypothetical protein